MGWGWTGITAAGLDESMRGRDEFNFSINLQLSDAPIDYVRAQLVALSREQHTRDVSGATGSTTTHRGVFVTVDGPGGAGKTTTTHQVRHDLTQQGYAVHTTAEPSNAQLGEIARHSTDAYVGHALACLVAADRYHHLATEIRPQLAAGRIVLCDRYVASSYVLQHIDGVPIEFLEAINSAADLPDLAVILTADPAVTADRIVRRGAHSRFETGITASRAEVELCRDATARLAERDSPLLIVDTTRTPTAQVATLTAGRIAQLAGVPHADSATE